MDPRPGEQPQPQPARRRVDRRAVVTGLGLAAAATAGAALGGPQASAASALHPDATTTGNPRYRGAWQPGTAYAVDDEVINRHLVYLCTVAHTSPAVFVATNWVQIGAQAPAYVTPNVAGAGGYPARPAASGAVLYAGAQVPSDAITGDLWIPPTTVPADIGAESSANKGLPNGYMGLDQYGRGASQPQAHAPAHAPGGYSDLHLFGGSEFFGRHENIPRFVAAGNMSLEMNPDTAWFMFFVARTNLSFTRLFTAVGDQASVGSARQRLGLYTADQSDNLTMVARTASSPTYFAASYTFMCPPLATTGSDGFPTTYTLVPGQRYAIGILHTGTVTQPHFFGVDLSALGALFPVPAMSLAGPTDLPLSVAGSSLGVETQNAYCGCLG